MQQREFHPPVTPEPARPAGTDYSVDPSNVGLDILRPAESEPYPVSGSGRADKNMAYALPAESGVTGWTPIRKDPAVVAAHAKRAAEAAQRQRVIDAVPKLPEERPATSVGPFSVYRPTETTQASYPDEHPSRRRIVQTGSGESGNQALARVFEMGGDAEPKMTLDVGALQQRGHNEFVGYSKGQDRIGIGKSTFVVCDGMGGETNSQRTPEGPTVAARVGAETIVTELETAGIHCKTNKEALESVKNAFVHASWSIEDNGGTGTTASVAKLLYVDGKPKLGLGAAGDSRMFLDPMPEEANQGTRRYIDEAVHNGRLLKGDGAQYYVRRAEQERAERLAFDGGLPYEWTVDELGHVTSTYVGIVGDEPRNAASRDGDIPMRLGLLDLQPGRTRVVISSDGITGDGVAQLIGADAFKNALEQRNPLDAAQAFMDASKKFDDKSIIVIDVYVEETGADHFEAPASPGEQTAASAAEALSEDEAAALAHWNEEVGTADAEDSPGAEPLPKIVTGSSVPEDDDQVLLPPYQSPVAKPALPEVPAAAFEPAPDLFKVAEAPAAAGIVRPVSEAAASFGQPLSRFDALTYDRWKDRLPIEENGQPLAYRDWLNMGITQRQRYLEQHGLWDESVLQPSAERPPSKLDAADIFGLNDADENGASDDEDETDPIPFGPFSWNNTKPFSLPVGADRDTGSRPQTQTSGGRIIPPVPPVPPEEPLHDDDEDRNDGWNDFPRAPGVVDRSRESSELADAFDDALKVAGAANSVSLPFSVPPRPSAPSFANTNSTGPNNTNGGSALPPPIAPVRSVPANVVPRQNEARRSRLVKGSLAALATVAALSTFEVSQSEPKAERAPAPSAPANTPQPATPKTGESIPTAQHEGNIDFQVTSTNGRVSQVTAELRDHGAAQHGAPWDAARTALEAIGIVRPTDTQIANLTNTTLNTLNMSPEAARHLPDGYTLTYNVVDGKLVPRSS